MNVDQWLEKYKPIQNVTERNDVWNGVFFDTSEAEIRTVQNAHALSPKCIWTLLEVEGQMFVQSGFHFANRMGYFITENPFEGGSNDSLEITVEDVDDEDSDNRDHLLVNFRVMLHEEPGDKFQLVFECQAENKDHAEEQAENAYPGCEIISCLPFDGVGIANTAQNTETSQDAPKLGA